jgi:hypothetical protein
MTNDSGSSASKVVTDVKRGSWDSSRVELDLCGYRSCDGKTVDGTAYCSEHRKGDNARVKIAKAARRIEAGPSMGAYIMQADVTIFEAQGMSLVKVGIIEKDTKYTRLQGAQGGCPFSLEYRVFVDSISLERLRKFERSVERAFPECRSRKHHKVYGRPPKSWLLLPANKLASLEDMYEKFRQEEEQWATRADAD